MPFAALSILAACAILLILTISFLASYAIMNLVLFLLLFAVGFLTAGISLFSFWGVLAALIIQMFVGLNPQEPVSSQTIIDNFLGLGFGMWIATIVNRLLWPILPQKVLRDSLLALCTRINSLLERGSPPRENPNPARDFNSGGSGSRSSDSDRRMFGEGKAEASRSDSHLTNVSKLHQPVNFSPTCPP